jgi:hypothetical protein
VGDFLGMVVVTFFCFFLLSVDSLLFSCVISEVFDLFLGHLNLLLAGGSEIFDFFLGDFNLLLGRRLSMLRGTPSVLIFILMKCRSLLNRLSLLLDIVSGLCSISDDDNLVISLPLVLHVEVGGKCLNCLLVVVNFLFLLVFESFFDVLNIFKRVDLLHVEVQLLVETYESVILVVIRTDGTNEKCKHKLVCFHFIIITK